MEKGEIYAYHTEAFGTSLKFSRLTSVFSLAPASVEEVRLMFQEDEFREKAEMN